MFKICLQLAMGAVPPDPCTYSSQLNLDTPQCIYVAEISTRRLVTAELLNYMVNGLYLNPPQSDS